MPRVKRRKSSTGIYHITIRGVNKSDIFLDTEDYETFLNYLQNIKATSGVEIYAYCLMTNHIHLLLKEGNEELSKTFVRLGAGFVGWYNRKYERIGHLFQSRYNSEVVENDGYLLMVMRYIHQNPVKAGISKHVTGYPWSSIHDYTGTSRICNTRVGLAYFQAKNDGPASLKDFMQAQEYEVAGELEPALSHSNQMSPDEIQQCFHDICRNLLWEDRDRMTATERWSWAEMLLRYGASLKQIETFTGVSRYLLKKHIP
jgi:REP element-mobilizing transposase RayT